jgi:hypothetical protein
MLNKLVPATLLLGLGAFVIGCSASASLDPNKDTSSSGSYDKQTTTVQHPDGSVDQTTKTQSNPY